jgi:hypothetical protein
MEKYNREFRKRFWSRVNKTDNCWEWQGYCMKAGYGLLQARKISSQPMTTHRIAWELRYGSIPDGLHVLHKCDNPPCVRPGHLFLGTQADNSRDRHRKGRTASGDKNGARTQSHRNSFVRNRGSGLSGEKHPQSKLTDLQVKKLREEFAAGIKRDTLAKKYGISATHVYRIGANKCRKSAT